MIVPNILSKTANNMFKIMHWYNGKDHSPLLRYIELQRANTET